MSTAPANTSSSSAISQSPASTSSSSALSQSPANTSSSSAFSQSPASTSPTIPQATEINSPAAMSSPQPINSSSPPGSSGSTQPINILGRSSTSLPCLFSPQASSGFTQPINILGRSSISLPCLFSPPGSSGSTQPINILGRSSTSLPCLFSPPGSSGSTQPINILGSSSTGSSQLASSSSPAAANTQNSFTIPFAPFPNIPSKTPYELKVEKWRDFVKRCHEVIAILVGLVVVYAPAQFVINSMRTNDKVNLAVLALRILQSFQINFVYPFLGVAFGYALTYLLSAANFPAPWIFLIDIVSVYSGFITVFVVVFTIGKTLFYTGAAACFVVVTGLFLWQFPWSARM